MPRCGNGHEQKLGLKCLTCGAELSYRDSCSQLLALPRVEPSYGKVSLLHVGFPSVAAAVDLSATLKLGETDAESATSFTVAKIHGGNWLDLRTRYLEKLRRWLKLVGFEKSKHRFVIVDTTNPLSVVALSALPATRQTLIIAITADQDSTPLEQNTSYVAISIAMKKGLQIIAFASGYVRELLFFAEDRGFASQTDAVSRIIASLLHLSDDVIDLMEMDLRLGVQVHCLSALVAGSKEVYPSPGDAFTAQGYGLSAEASPEEVKTIHAMVFAEKKLQPEIEKAFSRYRNKEFKGALSAECRFRERDGVLYDLINIYGLGGNAVLRSFEEGYGTVVKTVPDLDVEHAA